jgi:hypothetical protein
VAFIRENDGAVEEAETRVVFKTVLSVAHEDLGSKVFFFEVVEHTSFSLMPQEPTYVLHWFGPILAKEAGKLPQQLNFVHVCYRNNSIEPVKLLGVEGWREIAKVGRWRLIVRYGRERVSCPFFHIIQWISGHDSYSHIVRRVMPPVKLPQVVHKTKSLFIW